MSQVRQMKKAGVTFKNYFVTDSLCCPSRSTIFTGNFPHDTGVFKNFGRDGGIGAFYRHHDQRSSFNVYLHHAGYRTALMGKYLNGYLEKSRSPVSSRYVPPGWSDWDVGGLAYHEFDYKLNENGHVRSFGHHARDYLVDVMARKGVGFIKRASHGSRPFFLELSTYAPHKPYVPAPRYLHTLKAPAPRFKNFNRIPSHAPRWLKAVAPLNHAGIAKINREFDRRVESVMAVNDMIRRVRAALKREHQMRNTYIVFSSDNGLHMGQHRLAPGKKTAFESDIHVPLIIDGPHVPRGVSTQAMAQNTDLAPTFEQLAKTRHRCDGHSLVRAFARRTPSHWRDAVLVEHHGGQDDSKHDPDAQAFNAGHPPTYLALRGPSFTYVKYADGEHEYYDLRRDRPELHNIYAGLSSSRKAQLARETQRVHHCHSGKACWRAEHIPKRSGLGGEHRRR